MGIQNANHFLNRFLEGMYKRNSEKYNICVDGEYIRYKGHIAENRYVKNVEECIAIASFNYLKRTVNSIEEWRVASPMSVIVYMDGTRVHNKTMKRTECPYDSTLIRSFFMNFCKMEGYNVQDLSLTEAGYGEAELLMYLNRDKSAELNVYVTRDTDMISICCHHVPTLISTNTLKKESLPIRIANYRKVLTHEKKTSSLADAPSDDHCKWKDHELEMEDDEFPCSVMNTSHKQIVDINATYNDEELKKNNLDVIDSCVWWVCGNSGSAVRTIGFDGCSERFGFSERVFRTFFFMCGTDFNPDYFLTPSTICGFFESIKSDSERDKLNKVESVEQILSLILLLGLRGGGTLRSAGRLSSKTFNLFDLKQQLRCNALTEDHFDPEGMRSNFERYFTYIKTGQMSSEPFCRFDAGLYSRHFVYAMRGALFSTFTKKELQHWANETSFEDALNGLSLHLGEYDHKIACQHSKRKSKRRNITSGKRAKLLDFSNNNSMMNAKKVKNGDPEDEEENGGISQEFSTSPIEKLAENEFQFSDSEAQSLTGNLLNLDEVSLDDY